MPADHDLHAWVKDYYGRVLTQSADLKTNACCASGAPPAHVAAALSNVHDDVLNTFYGCGFPIPEVLEGATVLDLGCGTGRDVYVLAQLVGASGRVIGLDMTEAQLKVARDTEGWHQARFGYADSNVAFVQGYIEDLSAIESGSVDVIVSNCVVNLSPRKDAVLREALRVLKPGGEFYLSDVVVDRRLPEDVAFDPLLHSECLGGALYRTDFELLARACGFAEPRVYSQAPIEIQNEAIAAKVGAAQFESVTYRLFKLDGADYGCEDYGQLATYQGSNGGALFVLDDHHTFEAGRPERVCRNTSMMLSQTRFARHFEVTAPTAHFGAFPCDPTMAAAQYAQSSDGGCGPTGCC
jgi:SAM-dependent methyltransferase